MKSEVYSWRVSADLKTGLEREARRRKTSLSAVLEMAARDWLNSGGAETDGGEAQLRLHEAASKCFGALASGNAHRSENARQALRQRLRRRHDR
ncbi:MAG: hypothetical protein ABSF98_10825 [Bryobacteraceae bacterium]|jgi:hypothetical protein